MTIAEITEDEARLSEAGKGGFSFSTPVVFRRSAITMTLAIACDFQECNIIHERKFDYPEEETVTHASRAEHFREFHGAGA